MTDTDPAVELVARAVRDADPDGWLTGPGGVLAPYYTAAAQTILAVLADRLLPPVVQTREERGWWNPRTQEVQRHWSYTTDGVPEGPRRVRTITTFADDGSPYGGATLTGKWRNVDE